MRSMRSVERALATARRRGRTRASVPVASLQELLSLAGPALERQAQYERVCGRIADRIRRALAR